MGDSVHLLITLYDIWQSFLPEYTSDEWHLWWNHLFTKSIGKCNDKTVQREACLAVCLGGTHWLFTESSYWLICRWSSLLYLVIPNWAWLKYIRYELVKAVIKIIFNILWILKLLLMTASYFVKYGGAPLIWGSDQIIMEGG